MINTKIIAVPKENKSGGTIIYNNVNGGSGSGSGSGGGNAFEPHYLWGQYFDDTQDISGSLNDVTTINASGNITTTGNVEGDTGTFNQLNATGVSGVVATFSQLAASGITANAIYSTSVSSSYLNSYNAYINTLRSDYIDTSYMIAQTGNMAYLTSYMASFNSMRADEGNISYLTSYQGNIYNVSSNNVDTSYLDVSVEALIKDLTCENLTVTKAAHFFKLIIDEIKSAQGQIIITPANAKIDLVEEITSGNTVTGWRCYFRSSDADGNKINNMFEAGDQIICQTFNADEGVSENVDNKFYWRLCKGISSATVNKTIDGESVPCWYIDLSDDSNEKDPASNAAPEPGDNVVMLGNQDPEATDRKAAIIISAYDNTYLDPTVKSPSIVQYNGINDFNLSNHRINVISASGNTFNGEFVTYNGATAVNLVDMINDISTEKSYVYTAYSNYPDGTDMVIDPVDGSAYTYMGTCTSYDDTQPDDKTKYKWTRIMGNDAIFLDITPSTTFVNVDAVGHPEPSIGQSYTFDIHAYAGEAMLPFVDFWIPDENSQNSSMPYHWIITSRGPIDYDSDDGNYYGFSLHIAIGYNDNPALDTMSNPTLIPFIYQVTYKGETYTFRKNFEFCWTINGSTGPAGPRGSEGPQGPTGAQGDDGNDGDDGINGSYLQHAYKNSITGPSAPASTSTYPPTGWATGPSTPDFANGEYTWETQRTIYFTSDNTEQRGNWCTPFRITGDNGAPGEDGRYVEFIYKHVTDKTTFTGNNNPANWAISQQEDYTGPSGYKWSDNPQGVTETYKYEYMSQRTYDGENFGAFSEPVIWSSFGEKGQDGDGYEYIFKTYQNEVTNWNNVTGDNNPTNWTSLSGFDNDNYVGPSGYEWSDDPIGVDSTTNKFEYVSSRKKTNGHWGAFSTPALWAQYTPPGSAGQNGSTWQFAYKNATSIPSSPTSNGTYPPSGWTTNPSTPDFENGEYTWGIQRQITYDSNNNPSYGAWTNPPYRISGENGHSGVDGDNIEYLYCNWPEDATFDIWEPGDDWDDGNYKDNPANWKAYAEQYPSESIDENGHSYDDYDYVGPISFEWNDHAVSPREDAAVWMVQRTITYDSNNNPVFGSFSQPVIWSMWGSRGQDGDGVEYIYKHFAEEQDFYDMPTMEDLNINNGRNYRGYWEATGVTKKQRNDCSRNPANWINMIKFVPNLTITDDGLSVSSAFGPNTYNQDEFIGPWIYDESKWNGDFRWSDEPEGVSESYPYEYVSVRKSYWDDVNKKSKWGPFSEPKLWSTWQKGDDGATGPTGPSGTNGANGEYWTLSPLEEIAQVALRYNNTTYPNGAFIISLSYNILHINGTNITKISAGSPSSNYDCYYAQWYFDTSSSVIHNFSGGTNITDGTSKPLTTNFYTHGIVSGYLKDKEQPNYIVVKLYHRQQSGSSYVNTLVEQRQVNVVMVPGTVWDATNGILGRVQNSEETIAGVENDVASLEIQANQIQTTVSNNQITLASQLLKGTNKPSSLVRDFNLASWTNGTWFYGSGGDGMGSNGIIENSPCDANTIWRIVHNTSGNRDFGQFQIPIIADQYYTVSGYARRGHDDTNGSTSSNVTLQIRLWDPDASTPIMIYNQTITTTTWTYFTHTFKLTGTISPNLRFLFGIKDGGSIGPGSIDIIGIKLQYGQAATSWSEYPEDSTRNTTINTKSISTLTQTSESITSTVTKLTEGDTNNLWYPACYNSDGIGDDVENKFAINPTTNINSNNLTKYGVPIINSHTGSITRSNNGLIYLYTPYVYLSSSKSYVATFGGFIYGNLSAELIRYTTPTNARNFVSGTSTDLYFNYDQETISGQATYGQTVIYINPESISGYYRIRFKIQKDGIDRDEIYDMYNFYLYEMTGEEPGGVVDFPDWIDSYSKLTSTIAQTADKIELSVKGAGIELNGKDSKIQAYGNHFEIWNSSRTKQTFSVDSNGNLTTAGDAYIGGTIRSKNFYHSVCAVNKILDDDTDVDFNLKYLNAGGLYVEDASSFKSWISTNCSNSVYDEISDVQNDDIIDFTNTTKYSNLINFYVNNNYVIDGVYPCVGYADEVIFITGGSGSENYLNLIPSSKCQGKVVSIYNKGVTLNDNFLNICSVDSNDKVSQNAYYDNSSKTVKPSGSSLSIGIEPKQWVIMYAVNGGWVAMSSGTSIFN